MAEKPAWVVDRERARKAGPATVWLFGIHAVRDALTNPVRRRLRLVLTKNAADRLHGVVEASGMTPEISDARRFAAPLDPGSVHQGAALEVMPLDWGTPETVAADARLLVLLDRVSDPHNVGAVLRSAEVFGAAAVIAPERHSAPETGALAKSASGALERLPYIRVRNLADTMERLKEMGHVLISLDGGADADLAPTIAGIGDAPLGLVLGSEGRGLRERTKEICDHSARIPCSGAFGSLNVSNAAAVALYAASRR